MSLSWSLFYAGFSLLILAFLLWFPGKPWLWFPGKPWVRSPSWQFLGLAALLAYGIPAMFFYWTINTMPDEATRMRVSLLGLGFRTTPGNDLNITIGGDQAKHQVWVKQMQASDKTTTSGTGIQPYRYISIEKSRRRIIHITQRNRAYKWR
jgi:hypothetical protein